MRRHAGRSEETPPVAHVLTTLYQTVGKSARVLTVDGAAAIWLLIKFFNKAKMNWEHKLAETGYRVTGPRRAVMEVLLRAEGPLFLAILSRGQQFHRSLGLVTVYRALDLFAELGLVRKARTWQRVPRLHALLSWAPPRRDLSRLRPCRRVSREDDLQMLIEQVEAETGFRIQGHLLQLFRAVSGLPGAAI